MRSDDAQNRAISQHSSGFPPIVAADAQLLILGSLPGQKSLQATEYYAHPQNAFWRIMDDVFGIRGDYESRCAQLARQGVAVWDVLSRSVRPGSMDADIDMASAAANDFAGFLAEHKTIRTICFNGRKAEQMFGKLVAPTLARFELVCICLPSTSPAYAAMHYEQKLSIWRGILSQQQRLQSGGPK